MIKFVTIVICLLTTLFFRCTGPVDRLDISAKLTDSIPWRRGVDSATGYFINTGILFYVKVTHNVSIKNYFSYMDSLILAVDTFRNWTLSEYNIIHTNKWILDSLQNSDYYIQKKKGIFLDDQPKKILLYRGDSIAIPDSTRILAIEKKLQSTIIDLNIPEYVLRIYQLGDTMLTAKVRIGRNAKQYLELAGHDVDLRTPIGQGKIVRVEKDPVVINPETAKRYEGTYRDDGRFTKMPIIPWLEPEINDIRYGALIHPTTNPQTLGSALSHGCVGTSEADAWIIYYNAPIGTQVVFRYDLEIINQSGDSVRLPDVYQFKQERTH